jgi:precorrin-2 dehydrogenase/sirohydrochlorin ferrochelatase
MFPASLILEGRRCLLVGGGRVAARKGGKLVAVGADLTVIAPVIKEAVRSLPGTQFIERPFEPTDLEGFFLVFALTDNPVLNRQIVTLCRRKGILCSAADASWSDGDLILPASFSEDGLTVSVSTSGRSCRRSRLLRESLSRHVRFLRDLNLFILGADHSAGGFQSLEQLKARRAEIETILASIQGVHEFMVLDTCNRLEIVGLCSSSTDLGLLLKGMPLSLKGPDAFRRLAETAAGLHSQAFGESRIVAQLKQALTVAQEKGFAGSFLQSWTDTALHISKEIRQVVAPELPAVETEDLVCQWLVKNIPSGGAVLIVGRGEVGQGLARRFPEAIRISGRSDEELRQKLPAADIILCATRSPDFLIDDSHRPLLRPGAVLIDLSLPRNIDPALPGVIGLSELRSAVQPENAAELFAKAHEIISAHRDEYERLVNFQ